MQLGAKKEALRADTPDLAVTIGTVMQLVH